MRVADVGELSDHWCWSLVYDDCGHVQEFARQGLLNVDQAVLYIRHHFAQCLTCASNEHPWPAETHNVVSDEIHVVLSPDEIRRVIAALYHSGEILLAQRLDGILTHVVR